MRKKQICAAILAAIVVLVASPTQVTCGAGKLNYLPRVAATSTYIPSTDPNNPFSMEVGITYACQLSYLDNNFLAKVALQANTPYLIANPNLGIYTSSAQQLEVSLRYDASQNTIFDINGSIGNYIDNGKSAGPSDLQSLAFSVATTGTYYLAISVFTCPSGYTCGSNAMPIKTGIYEIPQYTLGQEISCNTGDDYGTNKGDVSFTAGYYYMQPGLSYELAPSSAHSSGGASFSIWKHISASGNYTIFFNDTETDGSVGFSGRAVNVTASDGANPSGQVLFWNGKSNLPVLEVAGTYGASSQTSSLLIIVGIIVGLAAASVVVVVFVFRRRNATLSRVTTQNAPLTSPNNEVSQQIKKRGSKSLPVNFCPACGAEVKSHQKFCPACGTKQ